MFPSWSRRPDVLAQWSRLPIPNDVQSDAMRARTVETIAKVARASSRSRARWRVVRWGASAAAVLILVGGSLLRSRMRSETIIARLYSQSGAAHATVHGRELANPEPSSSALALGFDSKVATDRASSSRLQLVSGVEIVVGPETRLALPDTKDSARPREELVLESGLVRVQVPKLPRGHFFGIRTPNAVVSVHGTAFSVEVTQAGPSEVARTKVVVTEGVVSVQHGDREILLDAGTEWTSSVVNAPTTGSSWAGTGSGKTVAESPGRGRSGRTEPETTKVRSSLVDSGTTPEGREGATELADQNKLFAAAMSARDRGDRTLAATLLEEFCRRYPNSPLTQDAYVTRFRVLAQAGDRAAAARAARSYLLLYGDGFAAEEARALAFRPDRDR
jgi:FecR-like protein